MCRGQAPSGLRAWPSLSSGALATSALACAKMKRRARGISKGQCKERKGKGGIDIEKGRQKERERDEGKRREREGRESELSIFGPVLGAPRGPPVV